MIHQSEFDKYIKEYRKIHTDNIKGISGQDSEYFSEYKIAEIRDRIRLPEAPVILDLGCGDGNSAKFFVKYIKNADYTGIDVSSDSIEYARTQYNDERIRFELYDGRHIPAPDGKYDIIFISCVMHHIAPNKRAAILKECHRVLKKTGKLIIFEHNPYNPITLKVVNNYPFDENAVLMTAGMIKKQLRPVGFGRVRIRYTIFFPRKWFFRSLLFLEKYLSWLPLGGQYYLEVSK